MGMSGVNFVALSWEMSTGDLFGGIFWEGLIFHGRLTRGNCPAVGVWIIVRDYKFMFSGHELGHRG